MATAYNLKVVEEARLRKERRLPVPGEVLVKEGDRVNCDTLVAEAHYVRGSPRIVDLIADFRTKLSPEEVQGALLKKPGDRVFKGEPIARFSRGPLSHVDEALAPCDGFIERVFLTLGQIAIREDPRSAEPISIVPVSSKLGVPKWMVKWFTQVKEGDEVFEGQILAAAANVGFNDYVYAPMAGVVREINAATGTITISRPVKQAKVEAHIAGEVAEVLDGYGAAIEATGSYLEGIFGLSGERRGELVIASDSSSDLLDEAGVLPEHEGKVLVAGRCVTLEAMRKAKSVGVHGIISGGLNVLDVITVLGQRINPSITGQEDLGFTLIVMEGFGEMPLSEMAWDLLCKMSGKIASIDGTTHVRARVIRPQVLISRGWENLASLSSASGATFGMAAEVPLLMRREVAVGDRVRCVRKPYAGLWGTVTGIPQEAQEIACEAVLDVAEVRLDDGRLVAVPEANLEVIQQ